MFVSLLWSCTCSDINNSKSMFQHNNARAHTAHATQDFLHQQGINVKDWPAFPPDMSPIGHARDKLGRLVYRRNAIGNLHQLEATLHKNGPWYLKSCSRTLSCPWEGGSLPTSMPEADTPRHFCELLKISFSCLTLLQVTCNHNTILCLFVLIFCCDCHKILIIPFPNFCYKMS